MPQKTADKYIKNFRVTMTPEEWKHYQILKKELGLQADAEVVRFLLNKFYKSEINGQT